MLAEQCAASFGTGVRSRGRAYFLQGRVALTQTDTSGVRATVRGSSGMRYKISLEWEQDSPEILAACTCPDYNGGRLCKHIWATMLTVDRAGWPHGVPTGRGTRVSHQGVVLGDEDDSASIVDAYGTRHAPQSYATLPTRLASRHSRQSGAQGQQRPSQWQRHLNQIITATMEREQRARQHFSSRQPRSRRLWYVWNIEASLREGGLLIDYYQQEQRQNGTFGKIKRQGVAPADAQSFDDPVDQRLVQLLFGNEARYDSYGYYNNPFHGSYRRQSCLVAPVMYELLVPELCATGRFVWVRDPALPVETASPILAQYGKFADLGQTEGEALRFKPSQALLLDALLAEQEHVSVDHDFQRWRQKLQAFDGINPQQQLSTFVGQLRQYQEEGLGWLHFLQEFHFGGCLDDDMGLGKTVQVLALLEAHRTHHDSQDSLRQPSLVVVPRSLVFNWIAEAARFTPQLRVLDYTGLGRSKDLTHFGEYDLIVTTYGTLRRDIVKLKDLRFDYAILDEAQASKNADAQVAKACRLLSAEHHLAMTGTPVENHLGELWSLFEFLNPGLLGSSTAFNAMAKNGEHTDAAGLRVLAAGLRPFLLRRTKAQVLTELPEKTEQTVFCEMATAQRKRYDELRDYYRTSLAQRIQEVGLQRAKIHVLEALLRLCQAACHPGLIDAKRIHESSAKIEALLAQLEAVVAEGHKALVFSQFTSLLAIVRTSLDQQGMVYEYLDGRTRKRQERVTRFQADPACPLFLISLKAGGHGLNLTTADYVFILDPWWNPAVEAQAVDRAHRIGQTRRVFAYWLICHNTVEEKILELQQHKRQLADAIVSADNSVLRTLTTEDLQLLLS